MLLLACRKSSRINTTLAVNGLTPLLIARLDHQDAIARLNLLKLIKVSDTCVYFLLFRLHLHFPFDSVLHVVSFVIGCSKEIKFSEPNVFTKIPLPH